MWVKDYLRVRYGELADPLSINCSNDPLWPVLVAFDAPSTGIRHRMQFTCGGRQTTYALHSEKEEEREERPLQESAAANPPRLAV